MRSVKKRVLDEDLSKVGTALRRAARQARKIAQRTHTPLVIYELPPSHSTSARGGQRT